MWIVDCLDEVESDLSVFHRIDDIEQLGSSRFFRLAELLPSYDGAVRIRLQIEKQKMDGNTVPTATAQIPAYEGRTLEAMTEAPPGEEFPGIEFTDGS